MIIKKIILVLIIILSITIVGELYYLFINRSTTAESAITTSPTSSIPPGETNYFPSPQPDQALNEGSLINLRKLKEGVVTSSTLTYVMVGTINQIDYLSEGEERAIDVTIKGSNGKTNGFRFPGTQLVTVINSQNENIDLFTIQQNDQVNVTVEFDMIKSEYRNVIIEII